MMALRNARPAVRLVFIDDGQLFLVTSARESARIIEEFLSEDAA